MSKNKSLPVNLILVRHGQSEGNVAIRASEKGDDSFFTPEFRGRHSRNFRLTKKGRNQAVVTGEWMRKNVLPLIHSIDSCYVSDYIRAKETAALLDLPNALWRAEIQLRERDLALMDNIPVSEKQKFEREQVQFLLTNFYSVPAGGGESFAALCLRIADFLERLRNYRSGENVIAVCHGHVMRAFQMEIEHLHHDDFSNMDKINNCQVIWYTRRNPNTHLLSDKVSHVLSVCPSKDISMPEWRKLERKLLSNEDLLEEVNQHQIYVE